MRILTGTFLAALLLNEAAPAAQRPQDTRANGGDKKTKLRFTVGKETTYVTRPVDRDGYIDYVAALNGQLRSGVTPDNNAAVLLWKAMGPRPEKSNMPPEFFRWLGSPAPPEVGDYHLPLNRFLTDRLRLDQKQITAVHEQLEAACRRPWTAKQYPHLAGWLKENDKPLAVVHEAVKRSHYYSPVVPARNEKKLAHLYGAPIPHVQQCRDLGAALAARATLRAGEGRYDEARQDLLARHGLGR